MAQPAYARLITRGALLAGACFASVLVGCASAPAATASTRHSPPRTPPAGMAEALHQLLEGKGDLDSVRVRIRWETETSPGSRLIDTTLRGNGVGISDHRVQFVLERDQVLDLLREFQTAQFFGDAGMVHESPETFGSQNCLALGDRALVGAEGVECADARCSCGTGFPEDAGPFHPFGL